MNPGPQRQRPADAAQSPQPPVEPAELIVEPSQEPPVEAAAPEAEPAVEPASAPSPEPTSDAPSLDSAPYAETTEPDGWDQPEGRPPLGELAEQSAPKEN